MLASQKDRNQLNLIVPQIKEHIQYKHSAFIKEFGGIANIVESERLLLASKVKAKLDLVAKVFLDMSIIDKANSETVTVTGSRMAGQVFPLSLCFSRNVKDVSLYLLNGGDKVIVSESVGLLKKDSDFGRSIFSMDSNIVYENFNNILSEEFDWFVFFDFVLESIHEVLYSKQEVLRFRAKSVLNG